MLRVYLFKAGSPGWRCGRRGLKLSKIKLLQKILKGSARTGFLILRNLVRHQSPERFFQFLYWIGGLLCVSNVTIQGETAEELFVLLESLLHEAAVENALRHGENGLRPRRPVKWTTRPISRRISKADRSM